MKLNDLMLLQKLIIKNYLKRVNIAVDATLGNGNDTKSIFEAFGDDVKVYAFDIQEKAIESSKKNIEQRFHKNVEFILDSHENMLNYVKESPDLVMFNLGYLPRSDHKVKTIPYTTLTALEKSLNILSDGGIICLTLYLEHDNAREYSILYEYIRILDPKVFKIIHINPLNQDVYAPRLIIIQKGESLE